MADIAQILADRLTASGWVTRQKGDVLEAEKEVILAKWFLGSRRVKHSLQLKLDRAAKELTLKETAMESTRGMAPPTFSVTTTKQQGAKVTETRTDAGFGGGTLNYGEPRQWIEQECLQAGWTFKLRTGFA